MKTSSLKVSLAVYTSVESPIYTLILCSPNVVILAGTVKTKSTISFAPPIASILSKVSSIAVAPSIE